MKTSLLAHIASNFISEYENVANSSIAYLLNKYQQVREVLKHILGINDVPKHYVTELSSEVNGRPDVTGLDEDGKKIIIIEGKFWANLTENQPNNYLKEISDEGKILFLAPEKRVNSLKIEIQKRIGEPNNKVIVCSWKQFLSLVEIENNKNYNYYLASDLFQLNELCNKMDVEGMPPLSKSDLDPMHGKIASNFSDLIDECNLLLREWEHSDFRNLKTTPSKYGHGFYFRGFNFGCYLHFDSKKWFIRDNHTPIWLTIKNKDWKKSNKIIHYLSEYDSLNSFENDYGILITEGMDKQQTVEHIVNSVKNVLTYLNNKVPDGN